MASFGFRRFSDGRGNEYELRLDLDDAAIMNDHVDIVLKGRVRPRDGRTTETEFIVRLNAPERCIEVLHQGRVVGRIALAERDIVLRDDFDELESGDAWARIREFMDDGGAAAEDAIEAFIESIPAIDPVFGCLIRAGLSTTVGQLLNCYADARGIADLRQRIWEVLRCLSVNSLVMASKFVWRTLRCAITGGWPI